VVVVLRQRAGRTLPFVVKREAEGAAIVAPAWRSGASFTPTKRRIGTAWSSPTTPAASTTAKPTARTGPAPTRRSRTSPACAAPSWASITTSRKQYLYQYANEAAWREDNRRQANGTLHHLALGAALHSPVSRTWKGYWQRRA
jgi:hypothetical protein